MEAITISHLSAPPQISSDIAIPEPGNGQILVKTIYTAINPVDASMSSTGAMVQSWPFIPGCDAAGTVVKVGANAVSALGTTWKTGDRVFGCTRLGVQGYTPWAEYFLFDAAVCIPLPDGLSLAEAAGTGVGLFTAALGVFDCLEIPLLDPDNLPGPRDEWAVVFGGAGSVGQFAVQLLRVAGFKVAATSSVKSFDLLRSLGATETVDYNKPAVEIVEELSGLNIAYAFDAVSVNNDLLSSVYSSTNTVSRRYTTTNTWEPLPSPPSTIVKAIQLGPIGQPDAVELNDKLKAIIPVVYKLLEKGAIKPSEYVVEGKGIEGIMKAWEVQKSGAKGSTKVVVKVSSE